MNKEIESFKLEKIFELMHSKDKPLEKCLIPFIWLFKRKRNPLSELIKHKVRLCIYRGKQVKGLDYWNTYAPVVQSSTIRLMMILHMMNGWHCRHLDYVLAFTQASTDTDVFLRIPTGYHVENQDGEDISDRYCLKLMKNCYGTKDAAAN